MAQSIVQSLLGDQAEYLLNHTCKTISKESIHLPGSDFVDRVFAQTNRNIQVLKSLQNLYGNGRLANTGYLSILPVDQGIEHSAGGSFAPNPVYFDPENIIKLAIEHTINGLKFNEEGLLRFAKLIAQHERERLTDAAMKAAEKGIDTAITLEREACARVADGWPDYDVQGLAEAIRARGQA